MSRTDQTLIDARSRRKPAAPPAMDDDPRWRTPGTSVCRCRGCQALDWIAAVGFALLSVAMLVLLSMGVVAWIDRISR